MDIFVCVNKDQTTQTCGPILNHFFPSHSMFKITGPVGTPSIAIVDAVDGDLVAQNLWPDLCLHPLRVYTFGQNDR